MNTCVKLLPVINTRLIIMKFIFFLFISLSRQNFSWLYRSWYVFFSHLWFQFLHNIVFMLCLIMWACLSVITKFFLGKLLCMLEKLIQYGLIKIKLLKADHWVAFLLVNVIEPVYYIFCIFMQVDVCLWFDTKSNFLYNLLADSSELGLGLFSKLGLLSLRVINASLFAVILLLSLS